MLKGFEAAPADDASGIAAASCGVPWCSGLAIDLAGRGAALAAARAAAMGCWQEGTAFSVGEDLAVVREPGNGESWLCLKKSPTGTWDAFDTLGAAALTAAAIERMAAASHLECTSLAHTLPQPIGASAEPDAGIPDHPRTGGPRSGGDGRPNEEGAGEAPAAACGDAAGSGSDSGGMALNEAIAAATAAASSGARITKQGHGPMCR